ncbi:TPA: L-fuculose-phosphate aldolase [Vibrio parahaemolyticus]|nr:L-fuculose-phosphate aldolase [Vibrio parahaemolyticus]ELA7520682.1 L-fuculose-phosphate aldolase [Vibrio parahaemolyticus]ELA8129423.1 L-fuculose-phosphate aldolase [Vibrio parahaemolyticus]ELC0683160.1 L-fuculose-phosphate aldolase [Vibrio parahaemolyticus]HAV1358719.1 L-fuculose-phosphate aldolase [Vibrio parahaemolyticus]
MNRIELSQQIIDTCLEMTRLGLNQGTAGNVSVRFDNGMLITPTGIPYEKLTPEHIVYVAEDGTFEEGKLPSSEWLFHLTCYQHRPDMNAVVHNHAINCAAISILNKSIPAIHYMIAASGATEIPCVPYATFGSSQLAKYVEEGISKSKAILLQHHGLIAGEVNLDKALWLAHEVEVLADLYLKALAINPDVPTLDDASMQVVLEKFKSYGLRVEK